MNNKTKYLMGNTDYHINLKPFYNQHLKSFLNDVDIDYKDSQISNKTKIEIKIRRKKIVICNIKDKIKKDNHNFGLTDHNNIYINLNAHRNKYEGNIDLFLKEISYTINHEIFHILFKNEHKIKSNSLHKILHILKPYGVF